MTKLASWEMATVSQKITSNLIRFSKAQNCRDWFLSKSQFVEKQANKNSKGKSRKKNGIAQAKTKKNTHINAFLPYTAPIYIFVKRKRDVYLFTIFVICSVFASSWFFVLFLCCTSKYHSIVYKHTSCTEHTQTMESTRRTSTAMFCLYCTPYYK